MCCATIEVNQEITDGLNKDICDMIWSMEAKVGNYNKIEIQAKI